MGRKELQVWLDKPTGPPQPRNELLLKLFFAHEIGPEAALRHLEDQRRRLVDRLAVFEAIGNRARGDRVDKPEATYWWLTLRHGQREKQAQLDWCTETIEALIGGLRPTLGTARLRRLLPERADS